MSEFPKKTKKQTHVAFLRDYIQQIEVSQFSHAIWITQERKQYIDVIVINFCIIFVFCPTWDSKGALKVPRK